MQAVEAISYEKKKKFVSGFKIFHDVQGVFEMLVDFHDGSLVATSVAVIGSCRGELEQPNKAWGRTAKRTRKYRNHVTIL